MKHLLLFEAFSSNAISKSVKFLKKNVSRASAISFTKALRKIQEIYDYPIDKLDDSFLTYMAAKDAIKIKKPKDYQYSPLNRWEVYCLTFWFSIEDGYLGYTGTGNKTYSSKRGRPFNQDEIDYIKNKLDIKKGKLIPISDYSKLNHLDKVIAYLDDSTYKDRLTMATLWMPRDKIYAIQNIVDGDTPYDDEWQQYGRRSWGMGTKNSPGNDHNSLHLYIPSDEDLHVAESDVEQDPKEWILPIKSNGNISSWRDSYSSCESSDIIENADFAIVFYLDDIFNPDKAPFHERPSDIKKFRKEEKTGATKLLSDNEIREQNIERYISKMLSEYGIKESEVKIKDIKNIILKSLKPNALIACRRDYIRSIYSFSDRLYRLMRYINDGKKGYAEEQYQALVSTFESIHKESLHRSRTYEEGIRSVKSKLNNIINSSESNEKQVELARKSIEIIEKIEYLGQKIKNNISSMKVDNIEDLKIIYHKLYSIRLTIEDDSMFAMPDYIYSAFNYMERGSSYDRNSIDYLRAAASDSYDKFIEVSNSIERMIDSYFR